MGTIRSICGGLLSIAVAVGGSASAATTAAAAAGNTSDIQGSELEEIIVHAQRFTQRLQDVPVAVTPVSGTELASKALHDLPQLTLAVPSLEVTTDNALTLRGVGSQIFSSNVDSSVGVTVDDISLGVPVFMSNAAFLDIDQIEALTGPQGLLFGRNASAGLLNIITKRPQIGKPSGEASVEYDNRDTDGGHFGLAETAILNLPTSENSALRLNFLDSTQDPIVATVVNKNSPHLDDQQKRRMGKIKWLWEPSAGTSLYLIGDYSRERGTGGIWDDSLRLAGVGGNAERDAAADGVTPSPYNHRKGVNGPNFRSIDTYGITVNFTHVLSDALTLNNIFGWRHYTNSYNLDSDISSSMGLDINGGDQSYNQYSEELRLAFKTSRVDGQVGLYAFKSANDGQSRFDGSADTPLQHVLYSLGDFHWTGRSLAAYGQANFHATEALQFIAGARVTNDNVAIHSVVNNYTCFEIFPGGPCILPFVNILGPTGQNYTDSRTHTNVSGKVGTQLNFDADSMVYATLSSGYKGPAMKTNLVSLSEDPYLRPETVDDLEAGMKAMFFERRLRLNIAGFVERFKDLQVQAFDTNGLSTLTNAEEAKATGIEINSSLKASRHLTFNYNATILDSHFTNFSGDPCYTNQPATTCPNGQRFQGAGIKTPTAASYHSTLEGIYEVPMGSGTLSYEANWYHRTAINFSAAAAPFEELGPIDVFGANISWRNDKGLSASLFCKNCTNEVYPNFILAFPIDAALFQTVSSANRWGYNSVRTIGAMVTYAW